MAPRKKWREWLSEIGGTAAKIAKWLVSLQTILTFFAPFLLGAVAMFCAAYGFFHTYIDSQLTARMEPYQDALSGIAMNAGREWDAAGEVFKKLLKDDRFTSLPVGLKSAISDGLLTSASNGHDPRSLNDEIAKIQESIGKSFPETAYRRHGVGWCLVRIGKNGDARPHLERAVSLYNETGSDYAMVYSIKNLLVVALMESKLDEAKSLADKLEQKSNHYYSPAVLLDEINKWPEQIWHRQLIAVTTKEFDETTTKFKAALEESVKKQFDSNP